MSPQIDHKKPAAAFAVLCVIALAVVGNGVRARAADFALAITGPAVLRLPVASGRVDGPPAQDRESRSTGTRVPPPGRVLTGAAVRSPGPRAGHHGGPQARMPAGHQDRAWTGRPDGHGSSPAGLLPQRSWRHPAQLRLRGLQDLGEQHRRERPDRTDRRN